MHRKNLGGIYGFFGVYRYLSNFHFKDVEYDGIIYPTTEHAYQAAKFLDIDYRIYISKLEKPKDAREAGQVPGIRPDWDKIKLQVMMDVNIEKFKSGQERDMILQTVGLYLEETNTWNDTYWGVCNGVGHNHLGKTLMTIRDSMRFIEY